MSEEAIDSELAGMQDVYIAKVNAAIAVNDYRLARELSAEFGDEALEALTMRGSGTAAA
jgi:hypothetical protein